MRAEPKTILNFLATYYETLVELFDLQVAEGGISSEKLRLICEQKQTPIETQMLEYKILRPVADNYEMRSAYCNLFEYILNEFKPLLPETIAKFGSSINELFRLIKEGIGGDKKILLERLKNLHSEVSHFTEMVEKNTLRLLEETRQLKSNLEKIGYREKVMKASFWIDYYITPLNNILDINHTHSVANKLFDISNYANVRRLNFDDEETRQQFEKLYTFLVQSNDDLLRQSKILTNELLPLIDRIRTESTILTGFIEFLRRPYKNTSPNSFKRSMHVPYSADMWFNAKEYVEQFSDANRMVLDESELMSEKWVFDKDFYKTTLEKQLPVDSFFEWCGLSLRNEYSKIETDKFFALTTLLFESDLQMEISEQRQLIQTSEVSLHVPIIKVEKYGIS